MPPSAPVPPLTFDDVYAAHIGDVERWSRRLCGPGEDVEDFVHDVFLVVHRRLGEWRGEAKISTWLFSICERIGLKRRRRRRRARLTQSLDRLLAGRLISVDPSPLEEAEQRQAKGLLYEVLDGLADKYRTPLILFEIEGMAGDEIARLLGIPPATVWVRLHRGRAKLHALMAARRGEERAR